MVFTTNEKYERALLSTLVHIQTNLEGDLSLETLGERVRFAESGLILKNQSAFPVKL